MLRIVIPLMVLLVPLFGACSESSTPPKNELHLCPDWDLKVPCGMTKDGYYYRLNPPRPPGRASSW